MADAERLVSFEACFNFRDIGGCVTVDGRPVRWGAVYRSDALHRLTTRDLETAMQLDIRTVIDLRSTEELDRDGPFRPGDDVAFHHVPVFEQELDALPPWLHRAPTDVMQAFLDRLRERHGSINDFLVDAGLDRELLEVLADRLLQT